MGCLNRENWSYFQIILVLVDTACASRNRGYGDSLSTAFDHRHCLVCLYKITSKGVLLPADGHLLRRANRGVICFPRRRFWPRCYRGGGEGEGTEGRKRVAWRPIHIHFFWKVNRCAFMASCPSLAEKNPSLSSNSCCRKAMRWKWEE